MVHQPAMPTHSPGYGTERTERSPVPKTTTSRGRILLADDEQSVREVVRLTLESADLTVDALPDGRMAVEKFAANPDAYAVVLLDMTMPGLGGIEAARAIRELRPEVPVVFMSGFSDDEVPDDLRQVLFLQKPFRTGILIDMMRAIIPR